MPLYQVGIGSKHFALINNFTVIFGLLVFMVHIAQNLTSVSPFSVVCSGFDERERSKSGINHDPNEVIPHMQSVLQEKRYTIIGSKHA